MSLERATLTDGKTIEYRPEMIGEGAMKEVYFTADKQSVVCFFKDQSDINRLARLQAVLGKFNPTLDTTVGQYWRDRFCWVTGIVRAPRLGVLAPAYPKCFLFKSGPAKDKDKDGAWFFKPKARRMLPPDECGAWINHFVIALNVARAVRRLHQNGLAHSDLSLKNVLIDPTSGRCIVIDIDSLVVPGIFPPDVVGTKGYIAPEVLSTMRLPLNDPKRKLPSVRTDMHALAVLIYQYLFLRHPLEGPKTYAAPSAEEAEVLEYGEKAIFVEHPTDRQNRPDDLKVPCSALGPGLGDLFHQAFVKGLHSPNDRPAAVDWERRLGETWDLLHPCPNKSCTQKWFALHDSSRPVCPFCGSRLRGEIPVLKLLTQGRPGNWMTSGRLVVYHTAEAQQALYKWHAFEQGRAEGADKTRQGYFLFHGGKWLLVNETLTSLTSPAGNRVPIGQAVGLKDGVQIRLSQEPNGRIASVQIVKA